MPTHHYVLLSCMIFAFKIACNFLFPVPYCMLLFSLIDLLPTSVIIVTRYEGARPHPARPASRLASQRGTVILPLSYSECPPVCHYAALPIAEFGLPLVFLYFLKSAFWSRVTASYLLRLVSLDGNPAHRPPLFRAVVSLARLFLFLNYRLLLSFP